MMVSVYADEVDGGPSGMGKSLTAEAIAEHLERPLYSISAAEVGTSAAGLEERLTRIFRLGSHWSAVLLLDEADNFKEKRSFQDISGDSLVAVSLRKLNNCGTILFLTTNCVTAFDEVILSRMHMIWAFAEIQSDAKAQIWNRFIKEARPAEGAARVKPKELDRLIEMPLNVRQIENVMAIPRAMASKEKTQA